MPRHLVCCFVGVAGLLTTPACIDRPFEEPDIDCTACNGTEAMVCVECGPFVMGSEDLPEEQPPHTVYLSAYEIDAAEVTREEYQACIDEGVCPDYNSPCADTQVDSNDPRLPAACLRWDAAVTYCEWVGKRLPTEAEWEKAARSDDERRFPWGDAENECERAVMGLRVDYPTLPCFEAPEPVQSFSPAGDSPFGASDMLGNVSEWVFDYYDEDYYSDSPIADPAGPSTGMRHVFRGGNWESLLVGLTVTERHSNPPEIVFPQIGFRCAKTPT